MSKRKGLREIDWGVGGGDDLGTVIYDNGHQPPEDFLARVQAWDASNVPRKDRALLTVANVKHARFRPMSPWEAKAWGCDHGVIDCTGELRGYPVTAVYL